ncbi:MAG: sulfatase [Candidatus Hydrogenedentes bacterium]|nr:sulfatase [Candidatus Hydrogenedentota bacterium]
MTFLIAVLLAIDAADNSSLATRTSEVSSPAASHELKHNVVLFVPDALRADFLSCYGYPHPTSPNFDALAQRGMLFERCYAQSSWTKPSIASLLTGLLPSVHRAVSSTHTPEQQREAVKVQVLRPQFSTLFEEFKAAGYQTATFQVNSHLQPQFGFGQGVDHYWFEHWADPAREMDAVVAWLEKAVKEPFIAYIHVRDPHPGFTPSEQVLEQVFGKADTAVPTSAAPLPGIEYMKRLYAGEVRYVDAQFGRLVEKLQQLGVADRTTFAVVSDHGESFQEHGVFGHGETLFDEVLHVPLIIRPARTTSARRVPWNVRMFDLYPSLLTLSGIEPPPNLQAESLFTKDGELAVSANRIVLSETDKKHPSGDEWLTCVIRDNAKAIYDTRADSYIIFDRRTDPKELNGRPPSAGSENSEIVKLLKRQQSLSEKLAAGFGPAEWTGMDSETREQLRSLGYLP